MVNPLIDQLFTSRIRCKLLRLFVSQPEEPRYLRQLERELDESVTPVRRELLNLVDLGLLRVRDEGHVKYYEVNTHSELYRDLYRLFNENPGQFQDEQHAEADVSELSEELSAIGETTMSVASTRQPRWIDAALVLVFCIAAANIYLLARIDDGPSQPVSPVAIAVTPQPTVDVLPVAAQPSPSSSVAIAPVEAMEHRTVTVDETVVDETVVQFPKAPTTTAQASTSDADGSTTPSGMASSRWKVNVGGWGTMSATWHADERGPEEREL